MQITQYFCQILINLISAQQIFEKSAPIKFYGNSSSGSPFIVSGHTKTTEVTVAFRNFVKATKMCNDGIKTVILNLSTVFTRVISVPAFFAHLNF
jgi:hypothetical protein